jgi:hypothetical protein
VPDNLRPDTVNSPVGMGEPGEPLVEENRRQRLRRLDDLLEALELCNLHEIAVPPLVVREGLQANGIWPIEDKTVTQLIDLVLERQADFLIKIPIERRKSPRRRMKVDLAAWLREGRRAD